MSIRSTSAPPPTARSWRTRACRRSASAPATSGSLTARTSTSSWTRSSPLRGRSRAACWSGAVPLRKPWAAVCDALAREGVEYVFGLPGNPELLYNDLYDHPQITPVLVRHETSAVFMAMAYARTSGRVGVVHASPGPGMANLVPGLLEAYYACSPLVCVVSAASRADEGQGGFQDAPSLEMVRPVTKWATRIDLPERT